MTPIRHKKSSRFLNRTLVWISGFLLLSFTAGYSATYYVSPSGSDTAGNGSLTTPWQTISKGQSMLAPGDTLYVRGGVYTESVTITVQGTENARITIAAYPGETPILDGGEPVTGWTRCSADEPGLMVAGIPNKFADKIYKARIPAAKMPSSKTKWVLFENGTHARLARWPDQNVGYGLDTSLFQLVPSESVGLTSQLRDDTVLSKLNPASIWYDYISNLSASDLANYWNGAYLQIWFRTDGNFTSSYLITGGGENAISIDGKFSRALRNTDAYNINRHPHLLNEPGEFYFTPEPDAEGYHTFYYWPLNVANLTDKISIPAKTKGFYASNKDYITIDGFTILRYAGEGIHFYPGGTNTAPIVRNCTVEDCGGTGIYLQKTVDGLVENCIVNRAGDRGVFLNDGLRGIVKGCTVSDSAGTCISFYTVEYGQILDNRIYGVAGVHANGVSCYLACKKVLIARNIFYNAANLALQNISDVTCFANVFDAKHLSRNFISTWPDSTNSSYATRGHLTFLHNTIIRGDEPRHTVLDFLGAICKFTDAAVENDGGKVCIRQAGKFSSSSIKNTGEGTQILCYFSAPVYPNGWYRVLRKTTDTVTINLDYINSIPTVSGQAGGHTNNYLYNNLIGGSYEWDFNVLGRSHNGWIPISNMHTIPNPGLEGEWYLPRTNPDIKTQYARIFKDIDAGDYSLADNSPAIGAGRNLDSILDDPTITVTGTSIRQDFPDFDFSRDLAGNPWAAVPSMGAYEYVSATPANPQTYTLTITSTNGTVSKSPNKTAYTAGETVTLTATPASGYSFTGWSGSISGTANPLTITMNSSKSITANFTQVPAVTYTLTVSAVNGTVTKSPNKTSYSAGETVTLTAVPDSGYVFANWYGDASGSANPLPVQMNSNKTIYANFIRQEEQISLTELSKKAVLAKLDPQLFDGQDDYTAVSTSRWNLSAMTFLMWFRADTVSGTRYLLGHTMDGGSSRIQLYIRNGQLCLGLGDNGSLRTNIQSVQTGVWYCVALILDNSRYSIFVNNILAASGTFSGLTELNTFADIGNTGNPDDRTTQAFSGTIDDVRIYTEVLSDSQLALIYGAQRNAGLTGLWQLDDYGQTATADAAGNGCNAVLIQDPQWGRSWADEDYLLFTNRNQALQIPSSTISPQAGTIALWVAPSSETGARYLLGHTYNGSNRIALLTINGKLAVSMGNTSLIQQNIAALPYGQMVHLALAWNNGQYTIYIDGEQKAAGTYSGLSQLRSTFDIGNYGDPSLRIVGFLGLIDEVRTYNRALAADEVRNLYQTYHVKENRRLAFQVQAADQTGKPIPYRASNLPEGASFDQKTQTFMWRPWYKQAGEYNILFDADGLPSQTVTITVQEVELQEWYQTLLSTAGLL